MSDTLPAVEVPVTSTASEPTALAQAVPENPPVADATKAEVPVQAKQVTPEKYDLKMPEGSLLEQSYIDSIAAYAKERGLSNEQAQELLVRENGVVSSYAQKQIEKHNQTVETWAKAVQADNEIGGQNYKENIELASRVVKKFASEEFIKGLNETGFGNHPEFVRVFTRIGKAMSNDKTIFPGAQPAVKMESYDKFYPTSKQP